jgi:hypothetical protein
VNSQVASNIGYYSSKEGKHVRGTCRQGAIRTRLEQDRLVRETNP